MQPLPPCGNATFPMVHSELYSTTLGVFRSAGWSFAEVEGREVLRAGFEAHHTRVDLHVQVFEKLRAVSVVAESSLRSAEPVRRERLAELAMRVNQSLTVGNFEMNWDEGGLVFRVTNLFPSPQGDPAIIENLVHNTVAEMDRIAPVEAMIHQAEGADLAALDIPALLGRDDLIPDVPEPGSGEK